MTIIARTGTHVLRKVTDYLGVHYSCSCLLFSVPAEAKRIQVDHPIGKIDGSFVETLAPTEDEARTRWQAHIDLLRLDCDRPWRWLPFRRRAA